MFNYIIGKITGQESNYVVIENNGVGFTVYVPNPYTYEMNQEYKIYLYNHIREDEYLLYGFKTLEEREMFLKLINVKGLGPKIAMPMLAMGSINGLCDAIERENVLYLSKFPKVGDKLAKQIILDLKGKLNVTSTSSVVDSSSELIEVLSSLGYKNSEIKAVIKQVDSSKSLEEQIKEALKLMLK